MVGTYIACAPEKVDQALDGIKSELNLLTKEHPSAEEFSRGRNYLLGNLEEDIQRASAQSMTMALMELYGVGFDDFLNYPGRVEQVKPDDIVGLARRLFDPQKLKIVIVGAQGLAK